MQASYWHIHGSLSNLTWGSYKLHNFPIGKMVKNPCIEKTNVNVTKTILSLYEMNKDGEIYSLHPSFIDDFILQE